MNIIINKMHNESIYSDVKLQFRMLAIVIVSASTLLTTGCDEVDEGEIQNTIELPTDSILNLYCPNEGIFEDTCVLDDPDNPYRDVAITEPKDEVPAPCTVLDDPTSKFTLQDDAPSAKARYYLWATALARGVGLQGENQYFTALSLHELYAENQSPTIREQALKAYQSLLENYFLSQTFDKFGVASRPECPEPEFDIEVKVAASLKDRVGENLVAPDVANLSPLFTSSDFAKQELGEWGFIYDDNTQTISRPE